MASGKESAVRGKRAEPRAGATLPYYKPRPLFLCAVTEVEVQVCPVGVV